MNLIEEAKQRGYRKGTAIRYFPHAIDYVEGDYFEEENGELNAYSKPLNERKRFEDFNHDTLFDGHKWVEIVTAENDLLSPVLGQSYNYFDDGKIKISRRSEVVITEIVPFDRIDLETKNDWLEEVKECDWLYAKETDFFVKADLKVSSNKVEKIIFVRTINNNDGWFSFGCRGGRLDLDGSLNAVLANEKK